MDVLKRCPACGQSDQVCKVSLLYVYGLQRKKAASKAQSAEYGRGTAGNTSMPPVVLQMDDSTLQALSSRLKPPASGKELPIRPVHPDLVVLAFSLVAPLFLYQILTSQPGMILPILIMLAGFYGFYLWKRTTILAKFKRQVENRRQVEGQVRRGIERWMTLYYCAREDSVFKPGSDQIIPADEMLGYLLQE
jgi:hypothetical protein